MSKSSNSNTRKGINRNDYAYEDSAIKAICEIYHSKYGTEDILTLPPVTGTIHYNWDPNADNVFVDVLREPIVELALETKKKIGFCHLKTGGFHWVAVTLSKAENSNNIICNVLNSTNFKNHPDVISKIMTEQQAEAVEGEVIFAILQPHLRKCLEDESLNNFNIRLNEPGIPVYKQTDNIGCGPNALENLRSA
ncbi:MAG: hypothetical protein EB127_24340, partial [Alphaproteobacteria bacterium]|nr:hypothetical protein [Alphaproteobacteria bacterium]